MTEVTRQTISRVTQKVTSVRVLCTVVVLGMWVYLGAVVAPEERLPAEFNTGLILLVMNWYWSRKDAPTSAGD